MEGRKMTPHIARLPEDLLVAAMEATLAQCWSHISERAGSVRAQREILRLVCRYWNEVIVGNAALWRVVGVVFSDCFTGLRHVTELVQLSVALKNGGKIKRHLEVVVESPSPSFVGPAIPTAYSPFLRPAFDSIRRAGFFESVNIKAVNDSVAGSLFSPPNPSPSSTTPWTHLRSLCIAESWIYPTRNIRPFAITSNDAPMLREVTLRALFADLAKCSLPWAQLTIVRLDGVSNDVGDYLAILSQCIRVEESGYSRLLVQRGYDIPESLPTSLPDPVSVTIPIRSLSLTCCDVGPAAAAQLDRLRTPNLLDISLTIISSSPDKGAHVDSLIEAFGRLILRSRCSITNLQLVINKPGVQFPHHISALLHAISPSVRVMTLAVHGLSLSLFQTWSLDCPKLDALRLTTLNRTMWVQRITDTFGFTGWIQAWTSSLTRTMSPEELARRKNTAQLVYTSLPEPEASTLQSGEAPAARQGDGHDEMGSDSIDLLRKEGWNIVMLYVGPST
ncbi:hypothetical protein NMY22_g15135 [Coprinellus aureogranulatus]|nr:hypothetical protein NMY22_g15135 [Coprinellus aureogranulatus]